MKKLLLVIAMVAAGFTANAQETTFGAVAGFNNLTFKASAGGMTASDDASGFYLGFFADFKLNDKFSIQPELQYVSSSQDGESSNQLALPVMAKYYVSEAFSVQAGPMFDLVVDETGDDFNAFGLGLAAGLGYDINEDFFASARYSFGLTNRLDNDFVSTKIDFLQIGVGYRF